MASFLGRKAVLTWGGSPIAGVRTKSLSVAGEAINVSDDDSSGWQEVLDEAGEVAITLGVEGLCKDDTLRDASLNVSGRKAAMSLGYPDGALAGTFYLSSYEEGVPYNEATTFTASFTSDGPVTWTPSGS